MSPITITQYLFSASVMVCGVVYTIRVYPPDHLKPGVAVIVVLLFVIQDHEEASVFFFLDLMGFFSASVLAGGNLATAHR